MERKSIQIANLKNSLIQKFEELNSKVNNLQAYSSTDFLKLARDLRNLHLKAKDISENSIELISLINSNKDKIENLEKNIKFFLTVNNHIKNNIETGLHEISSSIEILETTQNQINNFSNLIYKIRILSSIEANKNTFRNNFQNFDEFLKNMKWFLNILRSAFSAYLKHYKKNFNEINNVLKININTTNLVTENGIVFNDNTTETLRSVHGLNEITNKYFSSIEKIVTNIQYHDIIRQKLDHIIHIHKEIIGELSQLMEEKLDINKLEDTKYLSILPDITLIHSAQIDYTNKECQTAFENIKENLTTILDDTNIMLDICNSYVEFTSITEKGILFDFDSKKTEEFIAKESTLSINSIHTVKTIKQQFNAFSLSLDSFINDFDCFSKMLENNDTTNIEALYVKLNSNFNALTDSSLLIPQNVLNNTNPIFERCLEKNNSLTKLNIADSAGEYKSINTSLNKIVTDLSDKKINIINILEHITQLQKILFKEIHPTIHHIENSAYFSKTTSEIIEELNKIYFELKDEFLHNDSTVKEENLKRIEKIYTVGSERHVHQQIVSEGTLTNFEEETGDVELF